MTELLLIAAREAREARDSAEAALRRAVMAASDGGASIRKIAAVLEVSKSTVHNWIKEAGRGH